MSTVHDETNDSKSILNPNEKDKLLFYILKSYGINDALKAGESLCKVFLGLQKSKIYKYLNKLLPLGIITLDLYGKISGYYKEKNKNISDDLYAKIGNIIGCDKEDVDSFSVSDMKLNNEMINWLIRYPKVESVEILNYYDYNLGTKIDYVNLDELNEFAVLLKCNKLKFLYTFEVVELVGEKVCFPKHIYSSEYDWSAFSEFKMSIYKEYIKSLDFSKNIIQYNYDVDTRKRVSDVNFDFKSFDFNRLKNEIISSLENGYRRGYIFVGNPGTGKTSILLRLENEIRQYPILYVTPDNISEEYKIKTLFSFLDTINPCIVIFEDLDSYEMNHKNKKLGVFLNHIDNSKEKMKVVYLATINNSKGLNYSLVRPGRFDEIVEIKEPTHNDEIYEILNNHYKKQTVNNEYYKDKEFIKRNRISLLTYWKLKRHKLSHADYCEIIQKLILSKKEFTNKTFIESRDLLLKSKKSIIKYKRDDDDDTQKRDG